MKKIGVILVALAFLVTIVNIAFLFKDAFFYTMEDLPEGEFLYSSLSKTNFFNSSTSFRILFI